ncbi:hypothetical protein ACTFIU_011268 [Dictyostelium citrinum]
MNSNVKEKEKKKSIEENQYYNNNNNINLNNGNINNIFTLEYPLSNQSYIFKMKIQSNQTLKIILIKTIISITEKDEGIFVLYCLLDNVNSAIQIRKNVIGFIRY